MLNLLFGFQGRIGRGSWWLAQFIVIPVVYIFGFGMLMGLAGVSGIDGDASTTDNVSAVGGSAMVILVILALAFGVWVNVASTVKRFHDRNKSGLWFFIVFLPFIGGIWQLVECGFCSGDDGDNNYGPPAGSGRAFESLDKEIGGMATAASSSKLAKLDDDYFRNYAAQSQRMKEPVVQSTYARPGTTVSPAPAFGGRATFGRR